jgi:putative transposase
VSRAGFYRRFAERSPAACEVEMRDRIQRIALQNRRYGYRRVGAELRRQGFVVNHKKVLRLLREDNLLAVKKRRFVLTTETSPFLPVYPNLAQRLHVDGLDQLWVADLTYIRLRETFVYLAVVLDAYSRRAIGWELGETLETKLTLAALRQALATRRAGPGLVHHSDRGVQYTSRAYVELLESRGVLLSMSRRGNPYDNARAESFMKTLKSEEVSMNRYRDLGEARASIGHFLEEIYNRRRLHSSLGYVPPVEFEATVASTERREEGRVRYGFSEA